MCNEDFLKFSDEMKLLENKDVFKGENFENFRNKISD
jgi:hypothetical protein